MKAIVVALLAWLLVPGLALAQQGQAPAQGNLNTITSVSVKGGTVEIVGTKKPNFTTFTMTDPPRLVIDISEAVFSGVKEDITVGNGTITAIRTASYGSDDSAIARVLIGFAREVDPDIQATGNSLVISVAGGARVAQAMPSGPATAPAATGPAPGSTPEQAAVAAQADRQQQEKAAAQAAGAAQTDRQQQEKATADAAAAAQADRQQQEKAAAQAAAAAQAEAEAQRQAQARAEAERKAQEESARVAAQQAEQQRQQQQRAEKEAAAAAEKQRQEEARAAAEEKKHQQAEEKARREAEAQSAADARKRQQEEARAAVEEKKRAAAEERERQREEARAAAEEKKRQQAEARQLRVAQAETPHRVAPEQGDGAGASSNRKTMTLVGFKQEPSASRVFIRTNEPVRFSVSEGHKEVVLELENTRIAESNNTRALDTSFFDTAVASVDANAGPSRTVRVAIKLKQQVPYQTHQEGNELSIEFQRPAPR
ncbi:AMIN domain-containing protein [Vitiosangium sp. GDMCC 1.1324]|nr:AMIN domain-containing protein [Vitiosangium sp. GDMCC 1.1324]